MGNGEAIFKVEGVHTYYGNIHALKGVSLQVCQKEIVTLIGNNGAGKSTMLNTISGLTRAREGNILFEGEKIDQLLPHFIVRTGISQVPEGRKIFARLTVTENLEMGAFIRNDDYGSRLQEVYDLFPVLRERSKQKVGQLSGGQRQMVAMGRALMLDPQILLLDEPSAGLAPLLVSMIFEKIGEVNATGVAMIIVEQNAREALKMAHHGYVLAMGKNVLDDGGQALLANEKIARLYLGG